jgi:hypothetical protein
MMGREKIIFCTRVHLPSLKERQMEKEKLIKRIQRVDSVVERATKNLQRDTQRDTQ